MTSSGALDEGQGSFNIIQVNGPVRRGIIRNFINTPNACWYIYREDQPTNVILILLVVKVTLRSYSMPRNYKKVVKPYTIATIELAIKEVKDGASIRKTSAKYHMSNSLLRKYVKRNENEEPIIKDDLRVSLPNFLLYINIVIDDA